MEKNAKNAKIIWSVGGLTSTIGLSAPPVTPAVAHFIRFHPKYDILYVYCGPIRSFVFFKNYLSRKKEMKMQKKYYFSEV